MIREQWAIRQAHIRWCIRLAFCFSCWLPSEAMSATSAPSAGWRCLPSRWNRSRGCGCRRPCELIGLDFGPERNQRSRWGVLATADKSEKEFWSLVGKIISEGPSLLTSKTTGFCFLFSKDRNNQRSTYIKSWSLAPCKLESCFTCIVFDK